MSYEDRLRLLESFEDDAISRAHGRAHRMYREALRADSESAMQEAIEQHALFAVELQRRGWRHSVVDDLDAAPIPDPLVREALVAVHASLDVTDETAWATWLAEQDFADHERECIGRKMSKLKSEGKTDDQAFAISVEHCSPQKARESVGRLLAGRAPSDMGADPETKEPPEALGATDADERRTEPDPEGDAPADTDTAEGDGGEGSEKVAPKSPKAPGGAKTSSETVHDVPTGKPDHVSEAVRSVVDAAAADIVSVMTRLAMSAVSIARAEASLAAGNPPPGGPGGVAT